jgi:23S rRNA pseudouridine1911/1915/1917 synthase
MNNGATEVDKLRDDSSTGASGEGSGDELSVPAEAAGERLDRFIATHVGSRAAAERAVEAGVLVDGRPRPKSYRLEGGERVQLAGQAPSPRTAPPPPPAILFQDDYLAVVDKPPGLVVHPGAGHSGDTLVDALAGVVAGGDPERPGIVHRLDRDTSGLLLVARSDEAHARLSDLVRRRGLERTYLALVRGRPASRSGRIEAPIGRDRDDPTRFSLDTDTPRDAVTHFEVERLLAAHALLRVRLETGRTHQIRVHLAAIDLPVVGDPVYGVPEPAVGRQFLHAAALAFEHPFTGDRLELASPLPADLETYLSGLAPLP